MTNLDPWIAEVAQSSYGWPESLRFTYDKTRELLAAGVPGDLVECGTAAGVHPAAMAKACIDAGETRTIRLFDSFQGVPNGSDKDAEWNEHYGDGSGRLEPTGVAACSAGDVQANLARWTPEHRDFRYHHGWFQDSVPRWIDDETGQRIAFLRLDGDLYESYAVCLRYLFPLLSHGAILVCDDLNLEGCRAAVSHYFGGMPKFEMITESGDGWLRVGHGEKPL